MDLAQYKKAWENQPEEKNKVSALEIYKMTQTKSTSIAKWIFIIGLAEFAFWLALNFIFSGLDYAKVYEELNLMHYVNFAYYFNIVVIIVFLYVFYKNYSAVSTIDDTKTLMRKIIRVRKTVKFYVIYNIVSVLAVMTILSSIIINTPGALEKLLAQDGIVVDQSQMVTTYIISLALTTALAIGILFIFYYLLYGILLKKLNRNYRELTKLDKL